MTPNLAVHAPGTPVPEGWKPFVSLELPHRVDAPSDIADQHKALPMEAIRANILTNSRRGLPVLAGPKQPRDRPMVLVCFGPSLLDTWRGIRDEGGDIWTCSGAHRFLREHGIVPDYHTECDVRPHKATFLTHPCPNTHFVLASRVSPEMVDHVQFLNTTLYHMDIADEVSFVKEVAANPFLVRTATTNGMSAVQLGLAMGYRNIVIYGMDGCFAGPDNEHAGFHPNPNEAPHSVVEVDGRMFETSMLHLLSLQDLFTIALTQPLGTIEFRGDGMLAWAFTESQRRWREAHP